MALGVPSLAVAGGVHDALSAEMLRALPMDAMARFLVQRRWFGAKGHALHAVAIEHVIRLDHCSEWDGPPAAVVSVHVRMDDGRSARFQLLLAVRDENASAGHAPSNALARVTTSAGEHALLMEGTEMASVRRALGALIARGGACEEAGLRWRVELVGAGDDALRAALAPGGEARVGTAEQSNTSIVFGDAAILKLFRRLEPGVHPDVEIGRFLTTRTSFRHTPPLLAVVHLEEPGGEDTVGGMVQRYLPGSEDAWSVALRAAEMAARGDAPSATGGAREDLPFARDAALLGTITRALHDALGSDARDPAFAPERATERDVDAWCERAVKAAERALELLARRRDVLSPSAAASADTLGGAHAALHTRVEEARRTLHGDAGARIRHHGDYHLGQVLRTAEGDYMVIDFEGEPSRPLAARRRKDSPLRDVAGMLRSFSYAAASGAPASAARAADDTLERSWRWERAMRRAFLDAYLGAAGGAELIPRSASSVAALLTLFELEKVFYEITYELNNRPDWVWIPLRGAHELLDAPRTHVPALRDPHEGGA
ncbi:MAG TPA: putative maltokinase [Gemmatimonadaceae bacterium]|nr:putative maltokinase [Gemmatimonadaceae bacterium]